LSAPSSANGVWDATPTAYLINGSAAAKCNFMLFHGNISGTPTYINCAWSGSDAGMASVANVTINNDGAPLFGAPETWLDVTKVTTVALASAYQGTAAPTSAILESSSRQGDLAFADTSVASALPAIVTANAANPLVQFPTTGGAPVGVVAFTWAKNNNNGSGASAAQTAWSDLHNISTFQAQALFGSGSLTADFFTGVAADNGTSVYLIGRNKGSGTRANVLNDSTYGLNTPVVQFNIGGGLTTSPSGALVLSINGAAHNPAGTAVTDPGISQDDGYESGGNVANALKVAGSTAQQDPFTHASGWIAIGYLSASDASGIGGGTTGNWLTENGVAESDGAIESGEYSFWGYENLYGRANVVGTYAETVGNVIYNSIEAQIVNNGSNPANNDVAININFMNASKATDFSFPTHN